MNWSLQIVIPSDMVFQPPPKQIIAHHILSSKPKLFKIPFCTFILDLCQNLSFFEGMKILVFDSKGSEGSIVSYLKAFNAFHD